MIEYGNFTEGRIANELTTAFQYMQLKKAATLAYIYKLVTSCSVATPEYRNAGAC